MSKRAQLKDIVKGFPLTYPIQKIVTPIKKLRQARIVSQEFANHFSFLSSQSPQEKRAVFKFRHSVYCDELGLMDGGENNEEKDAYDDHSLYCLIKHKGSDEVVGAVRIVQSQNADELLPIENVCKTLDSKSKRHPNNFDRDTICEISRIAVSNQYRRRSIKKQESKSVRLKRKLKCKAHSLSRNTQSTSVKSEIESKCFSFIAVALYFAAAVVAKRADRKNIFVMVKPRLARSMRCVGIKLKKIGAEFDYLGVRAPYYINQTDFEKKLPKAFASLVQNIEEQIEAQLTSG